MSESIPRVVVDVPNDSSTRSIPFSHHEDEARAVKSPVMFLSTPRQLLRRRTSANNVAASEPEPRKSSFESTNAEDAEDDSLIGDRRNESSSRVMVQPEKKMWRASLDEFWIANYGAFLVLVSQFFGCMMTISTRLLETPGPHGKPMHPFQILFVRQSITSLFCISYALWSKSIPDFPLGPAGTVRWLLLSRGFFGFLGVFGLYFSLIYLPLSEATILTFLAPIGTCYAFSLLLPGETFSKRQQMAAFISLVGVVFIARPTWLFEGSDENTSITKPTTSTATNTTMLPQQEAPEPSPAQHLQAIAAAMMGVVGAIGAFTSIRKIGDRAHPFLSVNYFSVLCAFVSCCALVLLPSVQFRLPANSLEWALLIAIGLCGFVTQWLITVAMAYGASSSADKTSTINADQDLEMQPRPGQLHNTQSVNGNAAVVGQLPPQKLDNKLSGSVRTQGSKATSMMYSSAVFALVSDKIVFGITPGLWSWIGSGLILVGAIWVAAEGARSKTTSLDAADEVHNQNSSSSFKSPNAAREEEVGLLRDVEELTVDQEDTSLQAVRGSSSSTTATVHDEHVVPRISIDGE